MVVVVGCKMGRGRHPILSPWGLFLPTLREGGEEGSMLMTVIALIIFLFWRVIKYGSLLSANHGN